jgi:hypothetical protein
MSQKRHSKNCAPVSKLWIFLPLRAMIQASIGIGMRAHQVFSLEPAVTQWGD